MDIYLYAKLPTPSKPFQAPTAIDKVIVNFVALPAIDKMIVKGAARRWTLRLSRPLTR